MPISQDLLGKRRFDGDCDSRIVCDVLFFLFSKKLKLFVLFDTRRISVEASSSVPNFKFRTKNEKRRKLEASSMSSVYELQQRVVNICVVPRPRNTWKLEEPSAAYGGGAYRFCAIGCRARDL